LSVAVQLPPSAISFSPLPFLRWVPYRRHPLTRWLPPHLPTVPSVPLATSLITTTTTMTTTRTRTATTSYRPEHLLENNIHKVEPRRYDRLSFCFLLLSFSLYARRIPFLASPPSLRPPPPSRLRDDVVHLHLRSCFRGCRDHASLQRNTYRRCAAKADTSNAP